MGKDISQSSRSPKKVRPANACQRNPTGRERRMRCTQGDGLSDQAIGTHRVTQFADSQHGPWMRFSKRSLCLPLAIAIEDRTTEHKDEHRDGENDRTKAKANAGRQPPQRQFPALFHRSLVINVLFSCALRSRFSVSTFGCASAVPADLQADQLNEIKELLVKRSSFLYDGGPLIRSFAKSALEEPQL
jgi:hypothetical protein